MCVTVCVGMQWITVTIQKKTSYLLPLVISASKWKTFNHKYVMINTRRCSFSPHAPKTLEKASMMDLDSYLESVYEDLAAKVEGTAMILQLARIPDNLLQLSANSKC